MVAVQPRYLPVPYQNAVDSGRLILRDGSTATVRLANPRDRELMTVFFRALSKESRQRPVIAMPPERGCRIVDARIRVAEG